MKLKCECGRKFSMAANLARHRQACSAKQRITYLRPDGPPKTKANPKLICISDVAKYPAVTSTWEVMTITGDAAIQAESDPVKKCEMLLESNRRLKQEISGKDSYIEQLESVLARKLNGSARRM